MKRLILIFYLALFARFVVGQQYNASTSPSKAVIPVPDTVAKAFHRLVPVADSIKWQQLSEENPAPYLVDFLQEYQWGSAIFEPNGIVREYTVNVKIDTLPLAARKAIIRRMVRHQKTSPVAIALIQSNMWKRWQTATSHEERQIVKHTFSVSLFLSQEEMRQGWSRDSFLVSRNGRIKKLKPPHFR